MERGRIQRLPKFFWVPPIISGTGKAMDYKFGGYIYRVNLNKSLLKIFLKRARAYPGTVQIFWGQKERIKLQTSNFVGTFRGSIRTKAREKCWE